MVSRTNQSDLLSLINYEDSGVVYSWILTLNSSGRCIDMNRCDFRTAEDDEWKPRMEKTQIKNSTERNINFIKRISNEK